MSSSWDDYFLSLLGPIANKSKDPSTRVGCVIHGPDHEIRATGYNNMPRGCDDHSPERLERPEKYHWFEHAERNAIYNAARCGTSLNGCVAFVSMFPCMDCARGLVQSGIVEVVAPEPDLTHQVWGEHFRRSLELFNEVGVRVRYV